MKSLLHRLERLEEDTMGNLLVRVGPKPKRRARDVTVVPKGRLKSGAFVFEASGKYMVKFKSSPKSAFQENVYAMDTEISCTCPAWKWWGAQYWSQDFDYEYGNKKAVPAPKVNDPNMQNGLCKHAVAVIRYARENRLKI